MNEDKLELEHKGYTKGIYASRIAAVIESSITSLYSSIDTARKVVTHIYAKHRGLPSSTRKTFQAALADKIDERVPQKIRSAFKNANWYPKFRSLRDGLTHLGAGSCYFDRNTGLIKYFHDGLGEGNKAMCIQDIFGELDGYIKEVNRFLGQIFRALNLTLENNEVYQMCGVFNFRIYMRYVRPKEAIDFNSGRCDSYTWFEQPTNPKCPFVDSCGAYLGRNQSA
jgi:hypothetical protein